MSYADFGIHRFWKYSAFLQFLRCSFPRSNTSAKFHGYARITVSRLLPIHHHRHEYHYRIHWKSYSPYHSRPRQPDFLQRHWTVFWKSDGFINRTPFPLRREKWLSLFPHHIGNGRCDLLSWNRKNFKNFFWYEKSPHKTYSFIRAIKAVRYSIVDKVLLGSVWVYKIMLKTFHNTSPLTALDFY